MNFPSAIKEVIDGAMITRRSWGDVGHFGVLSNGFLSLHKAGEPRTMMHQWVVNDGDLFADDWVMLDQVLDD